MASPVCLWTTISAARRGGHRTYVQWRLGECESLPRWSDVRGAKHLVGGTRARSGGRAGRRRRLRGDQVGDAVAVLAGRPEEGGVDLRALEEEVQVVLPG